MKENHRNLGDDIDERGSILPGDAELQCGCQCFES